MKLKSVEERANFLYERLSSCDICPRSCKVNRLKGERGYCGANKDLVVYSSFLHHGEEPLISATRGSGTIFFSGCNLRCAYCQNHQFSHDITRGKIISEDALAKIMLNLQGQGAHNINLVTPTHFLPPILNALAIAYGEGLSIPIVYNTSGYEKKEVIEQLGGIIDVYLSDFKYLESSIAKVYSNAPDYPQACKEATLEMYRQGKVALEDDVIKKGLIIRHLVLPSHIEDSKNILSWIKENTPEVLVSVMFQYHPYFKASQYSQISRRPNRKEYLTVKKLVEELGLLGWVQDFNPPDDLAGVYFPPET